MEIVTDKQSGPAILSLDGRLTLGPAATALRTAIESALADSPPSIILDLAKLIYVDSAGLGALAAGVAQSKAAGIRFSVAAPRPRVQEAIELVCLNRLLPIHGTVEEARAELGAFTPSPAAPESPSA